MRRTRDWSPPTELVDLAQRSTARRAESVQPFRQGGPALTRDCLGALQQSAGNRAVSELVGAYRRTGSSQSRALESRNPYGSVPDDDVVTKSPESAALPAGTEAMSGQFDGTGAGANAPPPTAKVAMPPAYNVSGNVPITTTVDSRGRPKKQAPFAFQGSFAPEDLTAGVAPRCGEIHQFIRWDKTWGVRPHKGFDSSTGPGTWVEDRDSNGKRYGHRNDEFSDPVANCGDEYLSGTARDEQGGNLYWGQDNPGGLSSVMKGQWQFQLKAIDTCTGEEKASSAVISVNW